MCGIAGALTHTPIDPSRISACVENLKLRGPDNQSVLSLQLGDRYLTLIHTRLSIIDLDDQSNQPISWGSYIFIFNGELYNYLELKRKMEDEGEVFETSGDGEVFLRYLAINGIGSIGNLKGMFAFALVDRSKKTLTLATDKFAEKPLFYSDVSSGFYFGSNIRALASLSGIETRIDTDQLKRFVVLGYKSVFGKSRTFIAGVKKLEAGRTIQLGSSSSSEPQLYYLPTFSDPDPSEKFSVAEIKERLVQAVEMRMRADVPLAFCLSGGMDSCTLASIAARELGLEVSAYTISNKDQRYDEDHLVKRFVRELGIRHTFIHAEVESGDFLNQLDNLVELRAAPVATISYMTQSRLLRKMSDDGFKISVSGTGADEIFSGYYDHFTLHLASNFPSQQASKSAREWFIKSVLVNLRNPLLRDPDLYIENPNYRDHIYFRSSEFNQLLEDPISEYFFESSFTVDNLRNRMLNELVYEAVPVILFEDDSNAMAVSIENRSPFLDSDLLEVMQNVPSSGLIRDGYGKVVLREVVKGIVPDYIRLNRRKIGFNSSLEEVMGNSFDVAMAYLMEDGPFFDLFKKANVENLLASYQSSTQNSESKVLFNLLNSKLLIDKYGI